MSRLLIGDTRPNEIWVGNSEITQLYQGNDLMWERKPDIWTFYYDGAKNGITWQANKYGETATSKRNTSYLQLYTDKAVRGSWRTPTPIRVPRTAVKLQVRLAKYNTSPRANFGLIHKDVTGSNGQMDTSNGGQVYGIIAASNFKANSTKYTFTMTLNENLKNSTDYYLVVSGLFPGGSRSDLRVHGARFLDADGNYLN